MFRSDPINGQYWDPGVPFGSSSFGKSPGSGEFGADPGALSQTTREQWEMVPGHPGWEKAKLLGGGQLTSYIETINIDLEILPGGRVNLLKRSDLLAQNTVGLPNSDTGYRTDATTGYDPTTGYFTDPTDGSKYFQFGDLVYKFVDGRFIPDSLAETIEVVAQSLPVIIEPPNRPPTIVAPPAPPNIVEPPAKPFPLTWAPPANGPGAVTVPLARGAQPSGASPRSGSTRTADRPSVGQRFLNNLGGRLLDGLSQLPGTPLSIYHYYKTGKAMYEAYESEKSAGAGLLMAVNVLNPLYHAEVARFQSSEAADRGDNGNAAGYGFQAGLGYVQTLLMATGAARGFTGSVGAGKLAPQTLGPVLESAALAEEIPASLPHEFPRAALAPELESAIPTFKRKSPYGSYTITFESKKTYSGMGSQERSAQSAMRIEKVYGDPHVTTDWTPAESKLNQRFDEALRIYEEGGADSGSNYNKYHTGTRIDLELYHDFIKYILGR